MDTNNGLAELKNIHLPPAVSIFPLAPGWYLLALALLITLILVLIWRWHQKKRQQQINAVCKLLTKIKQQHRDSSDSEVISEVSILLKRVARMRFPKEKTHLLYGEEWLAFLDKSGKTTQFSRGPGQVLANIYQVRQLENSEAFFNLIEKWIRSVVC